MRALSYINLSSHYLSNDIFCFSISIYKPKAAK